MAPKNNPTYKQLSENKTALIYPDNHQVVCQSEPKLEGKKPSPLEIQKSLSAISKEDPNAGQKTLDVLCAYADAPERKGILETVNAYTNFIEEIKQKAKPSEQKTSAPELNLQP